MSTQEGYLFRYHDLVERKIINNRMTLTRWMKRERDPFPAPIRLGPNTIAWKADSVEAWLQRRAAATDGGSAA